MKLFRHAVLSVTLAAATALASIDSGLLSLAMPDAKILSGIQVTPSLQSSFGRFVLSQMNTDDPDLRRFMDETGFDPRRDLQEILIATPGGVNGEGSALVLGKGVFNSGRIAAAAKTRGGRVVSYKGIEILKGSGSGKGGLAFLDSTTAVLGDEDLIKAAIDRRVSGAPGLGGPLVTKARELASRNHAWFVTLSSLAEFLTGRVADPGLNDAMQGNLLQAVNQASGGVQFNAVNVVLHGEAVLRSEKDALALMDVLKFLAGVVQLNRQQGPGADKAGSLLDQTRFSTEGNVLKMTITLPEEVVERLFVPAEARKSAATRR